MTITPEENLDNRKFSSLTFLNYESIEEKLVGLLLNGCPEYLNGEIAEDLNKTRSQLMQEDISGKKIVVFGGGSGLANIIGGSSKNSFWPDSPFVGLKTIFPNNSSIVCITDDGGSTGELLKYFPLIALGDIRHVLLSSIQENILSTKYSVTTHDASLIIGIIARIFNYRGVITKSGLLDFDSWRLSKLPEDISNLFEKLLTNLTNDPRLQDIIGKDNCLGNLLLVSAIYLYLEDQNSQDHIHTAIELGLKLITETIGVKENSIWPCTSTPARLRAVYSNGVECIGEYKIGSSERTFPVSSIEVDYAAVPKVYDETIKAISDADLIIFAPGSLYSSILPILKVPQITNAIRQNTKALKLLITNLWVQKGETDLSLSDPNRKFFISDLLSAYENNIPNGTKGIFTDLLCMKMGDVKASIIQNYALEGKIPIYLDRKKVQVLGYNLVESPLFSEQLLSGKSILQHDPDKVAKAVAAFYRVKSRNLSEQKGSLFQDFNPELIITNQSPYDRYKKILYKIDGLKFNCSNNAKVREIIINLIWNHKGIPCSHLNCFVGITSVPKKLWTRSEAWDNILAYFDPNDRHIKFREDLLKDEENIELSLLVAIGESLLGSYAKNKEIKKIENGDHYRIGSVYQLSINDVSSSAINCYFSNKELHQWLQLSKMYFVADKFYTRLINGNERFTPPGLLMGLVYAWYLDNRLNSYIEHKMSVMKPANTLLLPTAKENLFKRQEMIVFFKESVFNFRNI